MILKQYYKIKIADQDVTFAITEQIRLEETDGKFSVLTFSLTNGYKWLDSLVIGNLVYFTGGYELDKELIRFSGYIQRINPVFEDNGNVVVNIRCYPIKSNKSTNNKKELTYPTKNSKLEWAKQSPIRYSIIIKNIAEESGYKIGDFHIKQGHDLTVSYKNAVNQRNMTDWEFMSFLAKKMNCVLWSSQDDNITSINCVDEKRITNTIAKVTFYFVARKGDGFSVSEISKAAIRLKTVSITLDSKRGRTHRKLKTKTDPKTGKNQIATDELDPKTGKWITYVLDEEALKRETQETRDRLQKLIEQNMFHLKDWSVLKKYFKESDTEKVTSREPVPDNFVFENEDGTKKDSVKKNITYSLNTGEIKNLSPEDRAALLGRSARGELSDKEFKKYFKATDSVEKKVNEKSKDKEVKTIGGRGKKRRTRNDDGFSIESYCNGDVRVVTKRSYVIEGISKYSNTYYLKKIVRVWGSNGYKMNLTFTK